MSHPDEEFGSTFRQLLLEAADEIHPVHRPPAGSRVSALQGYTDTQAKRHRFGRNRPGSHAKPVVPRFLAVSFVALIVVAGVALTFSVRHSSSGPAASGGEVPGELVVVRSSGAVEVMNPNTGAVIRTLVGPSPVGSGGKHLGTPVGVAVGGNLAYITYETQSTVAGAIYSVPIAGGHLSYVAAGMNAAVTADGSMLAYTNVNLNVGSESGTSSAYQSGSFEEIVVRDLKTGSVRTVYDPTGTFLSVGLSWSPDGSELLVTGIFGGSLGAAAFSARIGVLSLDEPASVHNPRFIWNQDAQPVEFDVYDAQFIGGGGIVAVLSNNAASMGCGPRSTSVLNLNVDSGAKSPVTTLPFDASNAQYAPAGQLVVITGYLPHCPAATSVTASPTTTTTTTPHQVKLKITRSTGASGSTTFVTEGPGSNPQSLYKWQNGSAVKIASKVEAIAYLPTS